MNKQWNVAIYARVSTDKVGQEESIPIQVEALENWLKGKNNNSEEEYKLIKVYKDEESGGNFNRPGFLSLKRDIENGKINMVLVRDSSRLGRDYIETGYYIERYFVEHNVRFVETIYGFDSINGNNDESVAFRNVINDAVIRGTSRRVKSALVTRMDVGSCISSKPPYGYRFEIETEGSNRIKIRKLVPANDDTTEVVKDIFRLYLQGWGPTRISTYLNNKGIPPPSDRINFPIKKFGLWNCNGVRSILMNPKYGGYMVQAQYRKLTYRLKKTVKNDPEDWQWCGEFEGIIDKETYHKVQSLNQGNRKNKRDRSVVTHPFSTVLKCNECGGSMSFRKNYSGYKCTNSQIGGGRCTSHSVKEDNLKEAVIKDLKAYIEKSVDKKRIYDKANKLISNRIDFNKKLKDIDRELSETKEEIRMVYKHWTKRIIDEKNAEATIQSIQERQSALEANREEVLKQKDFHDNSEKFLRLYKERIDRFLSLKEFNREVVESLISKIVISEDSQSKEKKMDIYYKFSEGI